VEQAIAALDREEQVEVAVRGMDDQQSLDGQPDALGLLVGKLVGALPAEELEQIAEGLLQRAREQKELVGED